MKKIVKDEFDKLRENKPCWAINYAVYKYLQECIITMKLEPGERIYESYIAKELGVSRSPVNFALLQLIKEDLVMREDEQAYYVAPLEYKGFIEICEARQAIEGEAAKYAALRITDSHLAKLKSLVNDPARAFNNQNIQQFDVDDNEFHTLIIYSARNQYIQMMYDSIEIKVLRYRYFQFHHWGEKILLEVAKNRRSHRAIYNAIANGYSEIAKSEMISHIGELQKLTSIVL